MSDTIDAVSVVAVGYEIVLSQDPIVKELKKAMMSVSVGKTSRMGLHFGSGSVGAPVQKTDKELTEWARLHKASLIVDDTVQEIGKEQILTLTGLYYIGIVFGEFVDKDGVKFIGTLLNPRNFPVMETKKKLASAVKVTVKPVEVSATPYIWLKKKNDEEEDDE